jgi:hypothetical protein
MKNNLERVCIINVVNMCFNSLFYLCLDLSEQKTAKFMQNLIGRLSFTAYTWL